ncbi:MAG: hypothetical protein ACTSRI_02755 [Promethearchaeota archaeon]
MSSKYPLWINRKLIKIITIYIEMDPLQRYNTVSQYLNSLINEKANEIFDIIKSELKTNPDLKKVLQKKENEDVLKAIELNLKF